MDALNVLFVADISMNHDKTNKQAYHVLLTGGAGFLGKFLIEELLEKTSVLPILSLTVFDLQAPKNIHTEQLKFIQGDVRDRALLIESCKGMDIVIHAAAIVDWGMKSESEIMTVNFGGTKNVIEACKANEVKALVFTSSLDVLFDGNPLVDVNEDTPYPERHSTSYCSSKYMAEKIVREASNESLKTCVLRPSDIFGEGDPYHIGSLIDMAKKGFYVRLGNGQSKCQHVYAGNVAYALILAGHGLMNGNHSIEGKAYFITDGPGTNFFKFFDRIVASAGYKIWPRNLWIPRGFGYFLGTISELIAKMLRPIIRYSPKMSRFAVTYTCTTYTFNSRQAENDFGFIPKYNAEEAFDRTVSYYRK
ncbi:NAD-dependent epimerase/dehydratase family protein [Bacteroidota bacterium]